MIMIINNNDNNDDDDDDDDDNLFIHSFALTLMVVLFLFFRT